MSTPLVAIDLDGTLVSTDLLQEAIITLAFTNPGGLLGAVFESRFKLARFKTAVARRRKIEASMLPYRKEVLEYARTAKFEGARLVLATAAPEAWAAAIQNHLGIFDEVVATTATTNLKGTAKLTSLRTMAGQRPLTYLGDSKADLPILRAAENPVVVAPSPMLSRALARERICPLTLVNALGPSTRIKTVVESLRPHHWLKNLLVFLPAVTGWGTYPAARIGLCGLLFLAFCAAASGVYLANDFSDIDADRAHERKRKRPIPSGRLQISVASAMFLCCFFFSIVASWSISKETALMLLGYLGLNALYSCGLKTFAVVDILFLASFYMIRITAGAAVVSQSQSIWFAGFLSCVFLEVGAMKRFIELRQSSATQLQRRGYRSTDNPVIMNAGMLFGFAGGLLLILYTQSSQVAPVYSRPMFLAFCSPLLISHNVWLWLRANRGELHDDPVIIILRSKASWMVFATALLLLLLSR